MVKKLILITFIGLLGLAVCPDWFSSSPAAQTLPPINYDIVYVRSPTPGGDWYWPQVTRYIRAGQSRQSLLVWKISGQRLDGRLNSHRPTETVPGNPATARSEFL